MSNGSDTNGRAQAFFKAGKTGTFVIAGPCSAESETGLLKIATALKDMNTDVVRAGAWKPRTRPGSFEGVGEAALKWIADAKKILNIPFAVEIANPSHTEKALAYGIDVLWLGARTTVNPFLVQEIAESLRGTNVPVMVKNPVNPDIYLWMGAIERLAACGVTQLAAVHRGFSSYEPSKYRNMPFWQIPVELKSRMPEIALICDPSHIAGNRALIEYLAQRAMDLNYDGLMIETHDRPDEALSDKEQQITPQRLNEILTKLKIRRVDSRSPEFRDQLEELRKKIDRIDRELLEVMGERMKIIEEIGLFKKENNIAVFQPERWKEILNTRPQAAERLKLHREYIRKLYSLIHDESIRRQTEIMNVDTERPDRSL